MPNLRFSPGVTPRRAKGRGLRGTRARHAGGGWLEAVKVVFLLQRLRRPRGRSSPSIRQIALVVVSAGIVLVIVRVATHRGKSRAGADEATSAPASAPSPSPASAPSPSPSPASEGDAAAPGNESPLADRVQDEMFHRSDAVRPDA
jgi:hypothetical protein